MLQKRERQGVSPRGWVIGAGCVVVVIALAMGDAGWFAATAGANESVTAPARQFGVNHAHVHRMDRGYGSAMSLGELRYLKGIGVRDVALTPFGYQRRATDAVLAGYDEQHGWKPGDRTMTDEHLRKEIRNARSIGMRVTFKPHVWSNDFWGGHNEWHGSIRQDSAEAHDTWWASYRSMILHYAKLCAEERVERFALGTELVTMTTTYPDEWRELARDVRAVYGGHLTYAAHWDAEVERIAFWDALDSIGVAVYYPLKAEAGADVEALKALWAPYAAKLEGLAKRHGKRVVFLEAGYRPVKQTHVEPWLHNGGELDEGAQAVAYEAMLAVFSEKEWWDGVYLWKTFTDPGRYKGRSSMGFVFRGRPAEKVIERFFTGG